MLEDSMKLWNERDNQGERREGDFWGLCRCLIHEDMKKEKEEEEEGALERRKKRE
jgi:hypothetical protein